MADKGIELRDVFNGMSVEDLTSAIAVAETIRQAKLEDAKKALLAEFRERAQRIGLPLDFYLSPGAVKSIKRKAGAALPVKFRNPATGETWSGRGRLPKWVEDAEGKGRKREEFEV